MASGAVDEQKMSQESRISIVVKTCELFLCFGAIAFLYYIVSRFYVVLLVLFGTIDILVNFRGFNTEDEFESHGE